MSEKSETSSETAKVSVGISDGDKVYLQAFGNTFHMNAAGALELAVALIQMARKATKAEL